MGEDKAFDYLKALHKNVNQYTKSGAAPARAVATGETLVGITFQHDAVVQAVGGAPVKIVSPCEGTGYEIGSMSIIKGAKNMANAKKWYDWALSPTRKRSARRPRSRTRCRRTRRRARRRRRRSSRDQAHQLRLREVRLVGRAHAPVDEVGQGSLDAAEVNGTGSRGLRSHRPCSLPLAAIARRLPWPRSASRRSRCCRGRATGGPSAIARASAGEPSALALCALAASWSHRVARHGSRGGRARRARARRRFRRRFLAGRAVRDSGSAPRRRWPRSPSAWRGRSRATGFCRGDATVATSVVAIALLLVIFIFYPVGRSLTAALFDARGVFAPAVAAQRLFTEDIWGLGCFGGGSRCGVAINSALLAVLVGVLSTLLGLAPALVVQRGGQRYAGLLKLMSILPIVTPPFVIALSLVVLFGRTGLVTGWLDAWFGIPRSRWIYGLPGVMLAQLLTFSPIAFMMLHGALAAVSPSLEEAAQTLAASRTRVFPDGHVALLRPALAKRVPARIRREPGRLREPDRAVRQFRSAVDQDLFRNRRRAARSRPCGSACAGAACVHADRLRVAAALARTSVVRHRERQGRRGRAGAAAGRAQDRLPRRCGVWIAFTLMCYAVIATGGFVKDIGAAT
jgi:ABC-type spermidine/putrescine transport system permease subunit II